MLEYIRKYFEPVPKAPSIEGKDLPEFDRSSKLTSDELEAARIGGSLTKVGGWRQPVKAPIWDHGEGPYPCISHYPGTKMILENINRCDVAALIAPPLVAFGYLYLKHETIHVPRMKLLKLMAEAVPLGIFLFGFLPYRRLIGYSRNDDEAEKYLGWKKPIYYDSDLLLKIPEDIKEATVVTAQPFDLGRYLSLMQ